MTNKLMFACRTCQFSEEALSSCVFRNNMYNTVGETAGVTQDVGSDPTVRGPNFDCLCLCCTLCGMELVKEEEEGEWRARESEEEDANAVVFDPSAMSGMEDVDEEMDGEPDTTISEQETTSSNAGEKGDAKEGCGGERIPHATNPERKTS